jgi:hypothetical protein
LAPSSTRRVILRQAQRVEEERRAHERREGAQRARAARWQDGGARRVWGRRDAARRRAQCGARSHASGAAWRGGAPCERPARRRAARASCEEVHHAHERR